MQKSHNLNAPHQAIITMTIDVMERLPTGQVNGIPIKRMAKTYSVLGHTYEECIQNINLFLEKLNAKL